MNREKNGKIAWNKSDIAQFAVVIIKDNMRTLFWFRNNLRLQDNLVLNSALEDSEEICFVYVINDNFDKDVRWGFRKVGGHRKYFLNDGLNQLNQSLEEYGHQLNIYYGDPKKILIQVYKNYNFDLIYTEDIYASEEIDEIVSLKKKHISVKTIWDSSLFFLDQLPFEKSQIPDTFTSFRKKIESNLIMPREPIKLIKKIKSIRSISIQSFQYNKIFTNKYSLSSFPIDNENFMGGEKNAINFLKKYFKTNLPDNYKKTRNKLSGVSFSTKFSPWLSLGFVSARTIFDLLKNYEESKKKNDSTYWIFFELLWRDYFRFIFMKYGDLFFKKYGLKKYKKDIKVNHDQKTFNNWMLGKTQNDFVNAGMNELKKTGFLSNRMRQVVASYLIYYLDCDWRAGAAWFESQLIDYDVYSNQGNWAYIAGLGTDPRGGRMFNVIKQQETYDPQGNYIKMWGIN